MTTTAATGYHSEDHGMNSQLIKLHNIGWRGKRGRNNRVLGTTDIVDFNSGGICAGQDGLVFVVDTREQLPYDLAPAMVKALRTGDYSVAGLEDRVAIERKSLDDLVGCLTRDRKRFKRELERGAELEYFALVVEGTLLDLAGGNFKSRMNVKSAVQSVIGMSVAFRVPVWFVHNRNHGRRVTESLLEKFYNWCARDLDHERVDGGNI
jgi:DNA excision repair protein ERCC-4